MENNTVMSKQYYKNKLFHVLTTVNPLLPHLYICLQERGGSITLYMGYICVYMCTHTSFYMSVCVYTHMHVYALHEGNLCIHSGIYHDFLLVL